jgi:hypothetical protein
MSLAKKIHFVAMVGVDVDIDIMPYWIRHYKSLNLDSYTVFLHLSKDEGKNMATSYNLQVQGFDLIYLPNNILEVNEKMKNAPDFVREKVLTDFIATLPKEDFVLNADGDEFQVWERNPHHDLERGVNVVIGNLVDCFDDTLHNPDYNLTLEENYPIRNENLSTFFKAEPCLTRKQCLFPVWYPVNLTGTHTVKLGVDWEKGRTIISGPIEVLHYRWRKEAINRVRGRKYWPQDEIEKMEAFFEVNKNEVLK